MSAINRLRIFNKVSFLIKNELTFFTSSEIMQMVGVDVWKRIAEDVGYPRTLLSAVVSSGTWMVSSPSDMVKLYEMEEFSVRKEDDKTLVPTVPHNYWLESTNYIGIYPASLSGLVNIPYVKEPTSLSTDSASNELSERCYTAAAYWIAGECMLKDSDQRYKDFTLLYDKEILRLQKLYSARYTVFGELQAKEEKERK
jgi:hypothetical protein